MKLPDCIVAATASTLNLTLVSADKGFKKWEDDFDFILYTSE
jgi:predicted nucleic acid-binding protein